MFPSLKDTEFEIMKSYWLVNLEVHSRGEPKNNSIINMQISFKKKKKQFSYSTLHVKDMFREGRKLKPNKILYIKTEVTTFIHM